MDQKRDASPVSITLQPTAITPTLNSTANVVVADTSSVDRTLEVTTDNPTALPFLSSTTVVPAGSQVRASR